MQETVVALDTEFYWRNTYYPQLCLIQIATKNTIHLIDTLAENFDLTLLNPLLASQKTLKMRLRQSLIYPKKKSLFLLIFTNA